MGSFARRPPFLFGVQVADATHLCTHKRNFENDRFTTQMTDSQPSLSVIFVLAITVLAYTKRNFEDEVLNCHHRKPTLHHHMLYIKTQMTDSQPSLQRMQHKH